MAKWMEAIDPVLWDDAVRKGVTAALLYLSDAIRQLPHGLSVFVLTDYRELATPINYDNSYLVKLLADIDTRQATPSAKGKFLTSVPDIISPLDDPKLKDDLGALLYYFATEGKSLNGLYVIGQPRNPSGSAILQIVKDKKAVKETSIVSVPSNSVQKRIASLKPVLNQGKHFMYERKMGKGKTASKFSAYDVRDEYYAKSLLQKAFETNEGIVPLNDLYVWDYKNGTYVHFMHSGQNEYHGFDITLDECPTNIRKLFGH